jgi:hypothetical protein
LIVATTAELLARLDKLRELRAHGHRAVQTDDDRIEYVSDKEYAAAIADLERQLAEAGGQAVHTIVFSTSKGL